MAQAAKAVETKQPRMTLASIVSGKQSGPVRVVIAGVEGIGKSTFGANAPAPIFLCAEDGTHHLDVKRLMPESLSDVRDAVALLTKEPHDFKTVVVDTLDWLEPLIWSHICKRDSKADIEEYGYGKGYAKALDEWREFLASLDALRKARGMNIILLAHTNVRPYKNPTGTDYDRFEMKLKPNAGGLIKEWADAVLFAAYESYSNKDEKTGRAKGVDTGARLLHTQWRAAWDAKNRYGLPETLPLDWSAFCEAVQSSQPADPQKLVEDIKRKSAELGGDIEKKALAAIERAKGDAEKLAQVNNYLNAKLAERT